MRRGEGRESLGGEGESERGRGWERGRQSGRERVRKRESLGGDGESGGKGEGGEGVR